MVFRLPHFRYHRMARTAHVIHLPIFQPIGALTRIITRTIVREQPQFVQIRHPIITGSGPNNLDRPGLHTRWFSKPNALRDQHHHAAQTLDAVLDLEQCSNHDNGLSGLSGEARPIHAQTGPFPSCSGNPSISTFGVFLNGGGR